MIIRVALAIRNKKFQHQLEESLQTSDVQIKSYGGTPASWQKLIRSCGDIVVISQSMIPKPLIVVIHDSDSLEKHAQIVAAGADVVLYAGISVTSITEAIESTIETRRQLNLIDRTDRQGRVKPKISDFISFSEEMRLFMDEVAQVIPGNSLILILGETGVGKEHLAKAIHSDSSRSSGPFITVNTAALPEQLLESELFGHEHGAFTGAIRSRRGSFELAHGGTIFLDEIGDMPLHLQTKLLRVLQDYEVQPVGGESPIWVDVRVIAATNKNLEQEVSKGNFRQDLFYRLSVITLTIPPLRKRREDIPAMIHHFINHYKNRIGKEINRIAPSAVEALCRYNWPGNVRELMNVIERAMLISKTDEITPNDLPSIFFHTNHALIEEMGASRADIPGNLSELEANWDGKTLHEVKEEILDQVERLYLTFVLKKTNGKVGEAAKLSGVHPRGLYNKMKKYGLLKENFKTKRPNAAAV